MNFISFENRSGRDQLPRRVLIVDDHRFFSSCLRRLLERDGELEVCDVVVAAERVLDRVKRRRPDLIVLDLSVGATSGYDLAVSLRAAGVAVPILFVSSGTPPPRPQLARVPGAAFAPKGGDPVLLLSRIKRLLAPAATAARLGRAEPIPA